MNGLIRAPPQPAPLSSHSTYTTWPGGVDPTASLVSTDVQKGGRKNRKASRKASRKNRKASRKASRKNRKASRKNSRKN